MKKILKKLTAVGLALTLTIGAVAVNGMEPVYASEVSARSFAPTDNLDGNYGFNDLALRSNGDARREFYRMLEDAAEAFVNYTGDLTTTAVVDIDVTALGLSMEELAETYFVMYYDNPQYYWMSNEFTLSEVNGCMTVPLKVHEEYCSYVIRSTYDDMLDVALQEYDTAVAGLSSSYDIALTIHDKLIQDVEYAYLSDGTPCTEAYAHSIVGVIDDSLASAVCEGYAKMYQLLLNRYGIENVLVCGIGNGDSHAWNLVQMDDGNYYCTDVTWDDTNIAVENGVDTSSYQYFNASAQDFDVLHVANEVGDDVIYYAVLPETSDSYDYTYYAQNGGLIAESVILNYANGTDTELESLIADAIDTYRASNSKIYLYSHGSGLAYMAQYGDVIGNAIGKAASSIEEFANGFSYSWYMLEDECIVDFDVMTGEGTGGSGSEGGSDGNEDETGPVSISLYKDGELLGEYAGLGSVFKQMTDEKGNYEVQFDPKVNNHLYIPSSWSELPKVRSIMFSGGKQDLGEVFYATAIEISSDFTMSGNVTFDYIQFVSKDADLYLEDAVLYLSDYARIGADIYAENAQIYAQHENGLGALYGDCDITLSGSYLALRDSAEIDILTVKNTGRVELMGLADQDYKVYNINKVVSEHGSPIMCFGNNHDLRISEIDLTASGSKKLTFNIQPYEGDLLPKIDIEKLTGVESVNAHYILSAFLSYTDSETGEEAGTQLVVLDKSILKNNDGYFLTCPELELDQVLATYSADTEWGVLVVNQKEDSFYVDVDAVSEVTWCDLYGHSNVEDDAAVAPTCTEAGLTDGKHCNICGKAIVEQKVVPALGHWEIFVTGKKATCTEDGLTTGVSCKRCSTVIIKQEIIPSTGGHVYKNEWDTTCEVCGNVRELSIVTTPMYRLYNPNSGEHFYTGSVEERDMLDEAGWTYEGIAWNAPVYIGVPVYRVFNPNSGDHHYTMSQEEVDMLVAAGWKYEGVAWNSASADNLPLYRLYNPNADCGSHHYTGSTEERDFLVSVGWIYEGIGWFGMLK